jgi:allantoinase
MLPSERLAYSAITNRRRLNLPNDARMVVWVITNVEEWDATQPMPRTVLSPPAGGSPIPDIPNWCWHEYGNRVGFWRLLRVYDEFKIPGVMNINGSALAAYPDIVRAAVERNWEFVGHGFTQRNMQKVPNERDDIRKTAEAIAKATGKRPRGWLGPGLTETWETPDILKEEGYDYVADWVLDDQPVWLQTRTKPIVSIPYTQECNDVAMMLIQHHKASEFYERAIDQFEQIYADAEGSARVMAISVHPYIMGAPHRTKYFRRIFETICGKTGVLFWNGEQILEWYLEAGSAAQCPPIPGLKRSPPHRLELLAKYSTASQANFPMRCGRCSTGSGRVKVWRPRLRPSNGCASSATAAAGSAQSSTTTSAGLPTAIP